MRKIADKWNEYKNEVLAGIDLSDRHELIDETLFFGGAAASLGLVQEAFAADLSAEEIISRLESLHEELLQFHAGRVEN